MACKATAACRHAPPRPAPPHLPEVGGTSPTASDGTCQAMLHACTGSGMRMSVPVGPCAAHGALHAARSRAWVLQQALVGRRSGVLRTVRGSIWVLRQVCVTCCIVRTMCVGNGRLQLRTLATLKGGVKIVRVYSSSCWVRHAALVAGHKGMGAARCSGAGQGGTRSGQRVRFCCSR